MRKKTILLNKQKLHHFYICGNNNFKIVRENFKTPQEETFDSYKDPFYKGVNETHGKFCEHVSKICDPTWP